MTGIQLKEACLKLLDGLAGCESNPDFIEALNTIAFNLTPKLQDAWAKSTRLENAMWTEIENHINQYAITDWDVFEYAVALLEHGWNTKEGQHDQGSTTKTAASK